MSKLPNQVIEKLVISVTKAY